jgi:hypothetical protein
MNTPLIDAAYQEKEKHSAYYFQKFGETKILLETCVAEKHIWNVEFEEAKHFFSSVCEASMDTVKDAHRKTIPTANYAQFENEHEVGYMFSPHLAGSYVKKINGWLKRKKITDNTQLQNLLALFGEVAALYAQLNSTKPYIEKGRKPNPNAIQPDLSHTGHCGICQAHSGITHVTKLGQGNKLVDHGFQISTGWGHYLGFRNGHCFGVGYQPLELSCEANQDFLTSLRNQLKTSEKRLAELKTGTATIPVQERVPGSSRPVQVWVGPSDARYAKELPFAITNTEDNIRHINSAIVDQESIIKNWKATPLLHGGYEK